MRRAPLITIVAATVALVASAMAHAATDRVKRPMQIHRVAEVGLEIWTEVDPRWDTRLEKSQGRQPIFVAETPALTYPPAIMTWAAVPQLRFKDGEFKEAAAGALAQAARNYGVPQERIGAIDLKPASYGDLNGYEAVFTGNDHGTAVDVRVFFGHKPGKPAVAMQVSTLQGKLTHLSEHVRRSWSNVRYLKKPYRSTSRASGD